MPVPEEYSKRRTPDELLCLTPEAVKELHPRPLREILSAIGSGRTAAARQRLAPLQPEARGRQLRHDWARLLGDVEPRGDPKRLTEKRGQIGNVTIERIVLEVEPGITVPLLLLVPEGAKKPPFVVGLAQDGKQAFLKHRAEMVAELLRGGAAVCLPDVRGTGETRSPGDSRGRGSSSTSASANEQMLGGTLLGARLRDVRSVLRYLRSRDDLEAGRIALWGESFVLPNGKDQTLAVPLDAAKPPAQAEPLGGLLALFGALFEGEQVRAVSMHGCLVGYHSLLESPFCSVPHDAVVPGALTAGDLCDVAPALAPRPLRLDRLVDGHNREVAAEELAKVYEPALSAYRSASVANRLRLANSGLGTAAWLLQQLRVADR